MPASPVMSKRAERALREASSSHGAPLPSALGLDGCRTSGSTFHDINSRSASPPLQANVWDPPLVHVPPAQAEGPKQARVAGPSTTHTWRSVVERMSNSRSGTVLRAEDAARPSQLHGVEAEAGLRRSVLTSQKSHRGPGSGEELEDISDRPIDCAAPQGGQATANGLGFGGQNIPARWTPHQSGVDSCWDVDAGLGSDDDDGAFWEDLESAPAYGDGHELGSRGPAPQGQVQPGPMKHGRGGISGAGDDPDAKQKGGRVILHVDVDAFYCSVERLDDPSLAGLPVAVTQFNRGGFVSVSHEVCYLP